MANYRYQKKYTSPTGFKVIQLRSDGNRTVSENKPDYLLFLQEGNTPEVIAYIPPVELTLDELKVSKIQMLKSSTSNAIFKAYPQYKVNNVALGGIVGYDESLATEMRAFINEKKGICDATEALILAATTKEELDAIIINFEM